MGATRPAFGLTLLAALVCMLPAAPLWHLHIKGDLDAPSIVTELATEIEKAESAGASAIVLVIDGNGSRPDVAEAMTRLVYTSPVPVVAWLCDEADGRVGMGQFALGLAADSCSMHPSTSVHALPEDDLTRLGPEDTDWLEQRHTLMLLVKRSLELREVNSDLADHFIHTPRDMWITLDPFEIWTSRPDTGLRVVTLDGRRRATVEMSAETALSIGLCDHEATSVGGLLRAEQFRGTLKRKHVITSGLAESHQRITHVFEQADTIVQRATNLLGDPTRNRSALRKLLPVLEEGMNEVDSCERLTDELPELLHMRVPGRTRVGSTPTRTRNAWRTEFQRQRTALGRAITRVKAAL